MKRSSRVGLLAASSASVLFLAACYDEEAKVAPSDLGTPAAISQEQGDVVEGKVYAGLEACVADVPNPGTDATAEEKTAFESGRMKCLTDWEAAKEAHAETAPKFSTIEECEAEFGALACNQVTADGASATNGGGGGGSFFMPMLAGYLLGNALAPSRPAYQGPGGGWYNSSRYSGSSYNSRPRSSSVFTGGSGSVRETGTTRPSSVTNRSSSSVTQAPAPKSTGASSTRTRSGGFGGMFSSGSRTFGG